MSSHKKSNLVAGVLAVVALFAVATAAYATGVSPNAFGRGGSTPSLASNCTRLPMFLTPAGKTWDGPTPNGKQFVSQALAVVKGQLDCSIRRTNRIIACMSMPVPTVTVYHGDDWKANNLAKAAEGIDTAGPDGVDALQAYIVAENQCVARVTGDVAGDGLPVDTFGGGTPVTP